MEEKEAYVVLVGWKPGVYTSLSDVTENLVGVPGPQYKRFTCFEDAARYYERAYMDGTTRAVKKPQEMSASRAARDAQIAAALAEARKNRIGPSASMPSVISTERSKSSKHTTPLARSATEPVYYLQAQVHNPRATSTSPRTARRARSSKTTSPEPQREPQLQQSPRTLETNLESTSSAPSSDIPTNKTQTRNMFENSLVLSTPRYAQSISYASTSPSLSLRSSDMRSHLSSPSSCGTRYFPEDWPARVEQRRRSGDRGMRGDDQSSMFSVSEYVTAPNTPEIGSVVLATAPNTPEMKSIELDVIEDMRDVANANLSCGARSRVGVSEPSRSSANPSSSANAKARPKTQSSVMSPPATPTEVISSPHATSTPRCTSTTPNRVNDRVPPSMPSVHVPPPSTLSEPKSKLATRVTRRLSEAGVQTDAPQPVRRRKNPEAAVQAAPPSAPKRQHVENEAQTSPATSPMRASTAVGDTPVRPPLGGAPCRCEHPGYACIHCSQRPRSRTERCSAHRFSVDVDRWRASVAPSTPTPTTPASPALSRSRSALSSQMVGTTPASMAGSTAPSESRAHVWSPAARAQASLEMMSFVEAAQGPAADAVVHDVSLDPRSPIQRGTSVPAGTSGSAVRPSPAMAPVPVPVAVPRPMGSLGLLFPS